MATLPPIPSRTEVTVVSADEPQSRTIGWKVFQRDGVEVHRPNSSEPLTVETDLKVGDVIWVAALVGGYHEMTVEADEHGKLGARTQSLYAILSFNDDDRHAWVCKGLINTRGLQRPVVTKDPV